MPPFLHAKRNRIRVLLTIEVYTVLSTHQGALAVELAAKVADDKCQASGAATGAAAGLDRVVEPAGHAPDVEEDVGLQVGLGETVRVIFFWYS